MASKESRRPEKPTVVIACGTDRQSEVVIEVLAGLEEEGVPFRVIDADPSADLAAAAADAAKQSKLRVGVSLDSDGRVCVQHASLADSSPLLRVDDGASASAAAAATWRGAGANAARLVKGTPLRVEERSADDPVPRIGVPAEEADAAS